jgi:putative membrane protein
MKTYVLFVAALALAAPVFAQQPTDAQIASIVVTANQVDIDAGALAESKGASAEVKAFGKQMAADHARVNASAVELVTKLKVTPEDNPTSKALKAGGDRNLAALKSLSGAAFDKAYIDNEVAFHKTVNSALSTTLIPGAQNPELKSLLQRGLGVFQAHLEHAERLAQQLSSAKS